MAWRLPGDTQDQSAIKFESEDSNFLSIKCISKYGVHYVR